MGRKDYEIDINEVRKKVQSLKLYAPQTNFEYYLSQKWFLDFIHAEEEARNLKNYTRRMSASNIREFKAISEFNWSWPSKIDKIAITELLSLEFMQEKENIVFIGPNGTGKTMLAKNIAYGALSGGHSVVVINAAQMLSTLSRFESQGSLNRVLGKYTKPDLLVIDELGQISFGDRHADMLFAVINERYLQKSTIITTNTHFKQWNDLFPNSTCVATIIDRLIHHAEVIEILGESFRLKESQERIAAKKTKRAEKHLGKEEKINKN